MNPQNAVVIGLMLTALMAYLLVLWNGSRVGHGVVITSVACLGFVAMQWEHPSTLTTDRSRETATNIPLTPSEEMIMSAVRANFQEYLRRDSRRNR